MPCQREVQHRVARCECDGAAQQVDRLSIGMLPCIEPREITQCPRRSWCFPGDRLQELPGLLHPPAISLDRRKQTHRTEAGGTVPEDPIAFLAGIVELALLPERVRQTHTRCLQLRKQIGGTSKI